jgi:protein-tyrosine kinase
MERISRALELARAQREGRAGGGFAPDSESHADLSIKSRPSLQAEHASAANSSVADVPAPQANDAVMARSLQVQMSAEQRERERILPPGSGGPQGGPYKMLRTQVMKRLDQLQANSLAVISAAAGAGKTLTAINLAIAVAADAGRTALLVDFDLRNPNVHRRFGFTPTVGIEECLASDRPIHEAMFKIAGYDRLTVLAARGPVEHSSELLRSQRAIDVMTEMCARYSDRVLIFDLPPVLQADDALAFSRYVQAGLLVVAEGRTRREDVTRTIQLLHELPIVGTVLNGSRDDGRMYY